MRGSFIVNTSQRTILQTMLTIDTEKLVQSLLIKGMSQAHLVYTITICKGSDIPAKLKKSVKKNASNFFDGGSEMQYVVFRVPENRKEPADATSKIVQMVKTNFLDGDPNNLFTTSEVQVGYIDSKKLQEAEEDSEESSEEDEELSKEEKKVKEEEKANKEAGDRKMFYILKFKIVK